MLTSYRKETREPSKGVWKKWIPDGQPLIHYTATAPLWSTRSPPRSKFRIWTYRSRGVRKLPRVIKWVPSGVHKRANVYMIKWCDSCMQVQTLTSTHEGKSGNQWRIQNQAITRITINPNKESIYQKLCHEHKHTQIWNKTSSNALNISVDKTCCISLDFGFLRLIGRENNSKKKTLIYIPYTLLHYELNIYNQNCLYIHVRQWCHHVITWVSRISIEVKSLVLLFLYGLVLLECLRMCSSVPVHIHSHRSKARLVIGNWWSG